MILIKCPKCRQSFEPTKDFSVISVNETRSGFVWHEVLKCKCPKCGIFFEAKIENRLDEMGNIHHYVEDCWYSQNIQTKEE